MEMAMYIMRVLKSQLMVVWSWGFNSPKAIAYGLGFKVQGFKFKGTVEVVYNEGADLFDISLIKGGKTVEAIEEVYIDQLVSVIDDHVEKVDNYKERVEAEYSLL